MSHILHFYHLVALDYVKPVAWNVPSTPPNTFTPLTRPFLAPRYDDTYYINNSRVNALVATGVVTPACLARLQLLPGWLVNPGDAINNYLVGQYLRALNFRRMCHEGGAIFAGREPICSGFTPGGITARLNSDNITKALQLIKQVIAFIGAPADFANGIAGTMMFDVVAAAHLFPEYFWIGNSYSQFMAYGVFESGFVDGVSDFTAHVLGTHTANPDNRGFRRGYRLSAQNPFPGGIYTPPTAVNIMKIGESIANSRYNKNPDGTYPPFGSGIGFKHPWDGETSPNTAEEYSWLKSPRYDIGGGNYQPFEVGPLARQVVQGNYFAGVLNALGYALAPVWGAPGPDLRAGSPFPYKNCYPGGGPDLTGVLYNGDSVLDRIAARAVECLLMALQVKTYINQVKNTLTGGFTKSGCTDPDLSSISGSTEKLGYGMTEASRGALGHWIKAKNSKISRYQAVVPTTWNANPRDINGYTGPAERSLQGRAKDADASTPEALWVADPNQPIEIPRVTHSYDFCIACAVHIITPNGDVKKIIIPALPG